MKENKHWSLLHLFGGQVEGEAEQGSVPTPQTEAKTGEAEGIGAPVAGDVQDSKRRSEEFRTLMEGEYKDLFTAYFQETFNRRFKEQKEMKEELERARAVWHAAAEHFGVEREALPELLRTHPREEVATKPQAPSEEEIAQRIARAVEDAVERTRAETEQMLIRGICARGLRPAEGALTHDSGDALRGAASRLSRAQRAELARRAARGERIKL